MTKHAMRFIALSALILLAWAFTFHPQVRAQDGDTIPYNDPYVVTLPDAQTVSRTFTALPGDSFQLELRPLVPYTYTAVLLDPNQVSTPLTPGADGTVVFLMDPVALGGTYTLVLQASGGGDLLIQLTGTVVEPVALALGETPVTVNDVAVRYSLAPQPDQTLLQIDGLSTDPAVVPGVPAFSLVNQATGATALAGGANAFPRVTVVLPAETSYLLTFQPGPGQAAIMWGAATQVEALPSGGEAPAPSGTCQLMISDPGVNLRGGPGTNFPQVGSVPGGNVLPVYGQDVGGTWYQVSYNGQAAWVYTQLGQVQKQGDCSTLPYLSAPSSAPSGPSPTPGGPTPTYTPTTSGPTATYTPTTTGPTPTYTPTTTGPTPTLPLPTPTFPPPSPTVPPPTQPPSPTIPPPTPTES
jgi:hypothetical protein